jgi:hypothetical protein
MEILNETVYDSGDLERFLVWVGDVCFEAQKGRKWGYDEPRPLPEKLRIGYYNQTDREDGEVRWSSLTGGWRVKVKRLGIVRPTKLPLVAMEVIARAAGDKDQRTLPREVMLCLAQRAADALGYSYRNDPDDLIDRAPVIRYDHKADRESAKAAKALAREQSIARLHDKIRWTQHDIDRLEVKLREANTKLFKAKARLHKLLKGKRRMEVTTRE